MHENFRAFESTTEGQRMGFTKSTCDVFSTEQHRAPASTAPITSFHAGVYRREGMFQVLGRGQLDRDARGAVANRATAARTESAVLTRGLL